MKKRKWMLAFIAAIVLPVLMIRGNTALQITDMHVSSEKIPGSFDGFRIVHISDVHDAQIGRDNNRLIEAIESAQPDVIVITGDLIDSNRVDIERSFSLAEQAMEIAPVYYVNGNHEASVSETEYALLSEMLNEAGVTVLENQFAEIWRGDEVIRIIGLTDIGFVRSDSIDGRVQKMRESLDTMTESGVFNVTLSHRPELADAYAEGGADLLLCGHAHGGQIRIPFLGGVIAPGQGLFPEYDAGIYQVGEMQMVVSRGIGNSVVPIRINNRPEMIVIELKTE